MNNIKRLYIKILFGVIGALTSCILWNETAYAFSNTVNRYNIPGSDIYLEYCVNDNEKTAKISGIRSAYYTPGKTVMEELVLPAIIDGYDVTEVGIYVCGTQYERSQRRLDIKRLVIPEGVRRIGNGAFSGWSELEDVSLPDSLEDIGYSFIAGTSIRRLTIPPNVNADNGFSNEIALYADKLEEVIFSEGIEKIPNGFLYKKRAAGRLASLGRYNSDGNSIVSNIKRIVLPSTLKEIDDCALAFCKSIQSIVIPYGVERIGKEALFGCESLTEIELAKSVKTLSPGAFANCTSLKELYLPNGIETIEKSAFSGCALLEQLYIPKSTKTIGDYIISGTNIKSITLYESNYDSNALKGADGLKEIVFGEGTVEIPSSICSGMQNLEYIIFPTTIEVIGDSAFYNCINVKEISFKMPSNILDIREDSFHGCESLKSLKLPDCVNTIGASAFYKCISMESLGFENAEIDDAPMTIGGFAFFGCNKLSEVTLSDRISEIGRNAFAGCHMLESITLPEKLEVLGCRVFDDTKVNKLRIPKSMKTYEVDVNYGYRTFSGMSSLSDVVFEDGTELIPYRVFLNTSVKRVYIPASVNMIETSALGSDALTDIYYGSGPKQWEELEKNDGNQSFINQATIHYYCNESFNSNYVDDQINTIAFSPYHDLKTLEYHEYEGYSKESFMIGFSNSIPRRKYANEPEIQYNNVKVNVRLSEGLSFSQNEIVSTKEYDVGMLNNINKSSRSFEDFVYIYQPHYSNCFEIEFSLFTEMNNEPRTISIDIPVSLIRKDTINKSIIDAVDRYASGEEVNDILSIIETAPSEKEARRLLVEYYGNDNLLDIYDRIQSFGISHDERWAIRGLVQDDIYLSWQFKNYLNNTVKGKLARISLVASGLVYNNEFSKWTKLSTYADMDFPGVEKYRTMLEHFIEKNNDQIEYYSYMKEAQDFVKETVDFFSEAEKGIILNRLNNGNSIVEAKSIFNNFIALKGAPDSSDLWYLSPGKTNLVEALDINEKCFKMIDITIDGIESFVNVESNLQVYNTWKDFLTDIQKDVDLPLELRIAAGNLKLDLETGYWSTVKKMLLAFSDDIIVDGVLDIAGLKGVLDTGGIMTTIKFTTSVVNSFVNVGKMVENAAQTEGYVWMADHYKRKLESSRIRFLKSKTEENAWDFYESYTMLQRLRIAGEEKFLEMGRLEGSKVIDGLQEYATGGTLAGLISDMCGYADREAVTNENLELLKEFDFRIDPIVIPQQYKYLSKDVVQCPVDVAVYDANENLIYEIKDGTIVDEDFEGGHAKAYYRATTGDYVKILYWDSDDKHIVKVNGVKDGAVSYMHVEKTSEDTIATSGFENEPVKEDKVIICDQIEEKYFIDEDGDSVIDHEADVKENKLNYGGFVVDIMNRTGNYPLAMIEGIENGKQYSANQAFYITCEKPCVVAYSNDDGVSYTKLSSTYIEKDKRGYVLPIEKETKLFVGLMGDVTLDGRVDPTDATQAARFYVNLRSLSEEQKLVSDVTSDGRIDPTDATQICRYYVNLRDFSW